MPTTSFGVVSFRIGLRAPLAAPKEPFFAVTGFVPVPAVNHFLPWPFWDSALAAAVFEAGLVRPSLRTLLAAVAALLLVCFRLGAMFRDLLRAVGKISERFRHAATVCCDA